MDQAKVKKLLIILGALAFGMVLAAYVIMNKENKEEGNATTVIENNLPKSLTLEEIREALSRQASENESDLNVRKLSEEEIQSALRKGGRENQIVRTLTAKEIHDSLDKKSGE